MKDGSLRRLGFVDRASEWNISLGGLPNGGACQQLEEIPRLGSRVVQTGKGDVAVFRNNSDEVFALEDQCPHKGGPLSQGIVFDRKVACPLHGWTEVYLNFS